MADWRVPLPPYMEAVLAWLEQRGMWFYLVCFSRGSAWGAQLLRRCPNRIAGALFYAGYDTGQSRDEQVEAAQALLRPDVPVVIVHTLQDEHSNPNSDPQYWSTLM